MKLRFGRLTIQNFKAYTGKHVVELDVPGVTYIKGENEIDKGLDANGASKSSLFDAWAWCLFGCTPAGLRNPDILPWGVSTADGTRVTLELRVDDNVHSISRTASPNRLCWDNADIGQEALNGKLGLNQHLAFHTILLAQGEDLFFDLPPEKKMDLFADTLELNKWDDRSELAGQKERDSELSADARRIEVEKHTATIASIGASLEETTKLAEDWAAQARKKKREATSKRQKLEHQLEIVQKKVDDATLKADGAAIELKSLRAELSKIFDESAKANRELQRAELRIAEAARQKQIVEESLAELKQTKTCPTCGQVVKPTNLANHKSGLERALAAHKATIATGVPAKVQAAVALFKQRRAATERYIVSFDAKLETAETTLGAHRPELARLTAELKALRSEEVGEGEAVTNPYTALVKDLQERRKGARGLLALAQKGFSSASLAAERYRFWKRGFKEIKLQLIEEVLAELEISTNAMLDAVGLLEWKVRYDIERETKSGTIKRALHVEIKSPESKEFVKWKSWSGGERQRLKLVGALALSDVLLAKAGVQTNLEILDEPAVYWSAGGVESLGAFLADRARDLKRSIFYVEHQAAESANFSRILTVVKDKEGAYVVEN